MSNTKDTPMDYRQLDDFLQTYLPDEYYEDIRAKIVPALQSLLDEQNVSLKLELQKQKELNAELVKIKDLVEELIEVSHFRNQWEATTEAFESLIKKSNEI